MRNLWRFFLNLSLFTSLTPALCLHAQWNPLNPVAGVQQLPDGVVLTLKSGVMRVQPCTDSIIRVTYSPTSSFPTRPDFVVVKTAWPAVEWRTESGEKSLSLITGRLRVTVNLGDGTIAYHDSAGKRLLQEGPKTMTPVRVNGEETWRAETFIGLWGSTEAFYGLGQHQAGVWNYHGESVDISQDNTNISIPLLLSSNGYGLFWNNTSRSRFNNRFVHSLYISSEVADVIDYYFLYGPDFDRIIAGYRVLTGAAPMFGRWAYGFWQCKNRYKAQKELLDIAHRYRELHIPVDNIVQDWFWWTRKGEHVFNSNYPDPKKMVDELHRNNFHLMISVWPFFERGSKVYDEMDQRGWFIDRTKVAGFHPEGMAVYDASNPEARAYYWQLMNKALFQIGVDAWWLDTVEPETEGREENIQLHNKIAIGSGARYVNLYPLLTTQGVYEGQRGVSTKKRVFILSRSAFAGNQRNSIAAWSGDVNSDFESYRRQIPAGLNFALSGIPYWTTDIGGFTSGNPEDPAYRELFVRWFQYGAFCPIFRVHGTRTNDQNELWSYGPEAQAILTSFDRLRYRLLPYIYSLAWKTTSQGYTPMRPLVMDFSADSRVLNIGDQFMYGPSILVSPVTEQGAVRRHLYLPKGAWVDFWTGKTLDGGRAIDAEAPLNRLPLCVRAGSIIPMGPDVEYAAEKAADPIELRVYGGADTGFTLYEDENDGYDYEKGFYATIPIRWDNTKQVLTIGERAGRFPGMLETRTFRIVFAVEGHGTGIEPSDQPDKIIQYAGKQVEISRR
jgi:alpha-D-xyloside xylohydrolase